MKNMIAVSLVVHRWWPHHVVNTLVYTELAAFVSGALICVRPVARAVLNVLDSTLVQLVTLKLSDNTCLFSKGGQKSPNVSTRLCQQQEVFSLSLTSLFCFSASALASILCWTLSSYIGATELVAKAGQWQQVLVQLGLLTRTTGLSVPGRRGYPPHCELVVFKPWPLIARHSYRSGLSWSLSSLFSASLGVSAI